MYIIPSTKRLSSKNITLESALERVVDDRALAGHVITIESHGVLASLELSGGDRGSSCGVTGILLSSAVRNGGSAKSTGVCGVGAGVVLDRAGSLESGSLTYEGVSVHGEWSGSSGGGNGWCYASEGSSEGLDVGSRGGSCGTGGTCRCASGLGKFD